MFHHAFQKIIPLTLILLTVLPVSIHAEEKFPYDPIYHTSSYVDNSAESPEEQKIYSFVQTTWKYYPDLRWTGPWSCIEAGGQEFFYFGCGICCLTNIYDTLTGDVVSPTTMYEWCRKYSSYNPDSGKGAISWGQLTEMCRKLGLDATVHKKKDYNTFMNDLKEADCVLALVSKDGIGSIWPDTNGHYITLWNYDTPSHTVFVTDSSGLRNRTRVRLSDVFK